MSKHGRPARTRSSNRRWAAHGIWLSAAWTLGWLTLAAGAGGLDLGSTLALSLGFLSLVSAGLTERTRLARELGRSHDALSRRASELAAIHAIARDAGSTHAARRVLEIVESECRRAFALDACIAVLDEPGHGLRTLYRRPRGAAAVPGLAVAAAASAAPLRIDDVAELHPGSPLAADWPAGLRSALAAPLVVDGRALGALCVYARAARAYDEHHVALLATVARQVALALDAGRNYHKTTLDALTGFHSREYFFRRLDEEHRRAARYGGSFSLMMLDLDGFKQINDAHGHLAGDRFLRGVADAVRGELRDADVPCRYGGDEFCVLLPETTPQGARTIAERVRAAVARHALDLGPVSLNATISIGLAAFPDEAGRSYADLLHAADQALYRAKRAGRDRVAAPAA